MSHPHIPTMYGFYEDEQRVTLILGFVEGEPYIKDSNTEHRRIPSQTLRS